MFPLNKANRTEPNMEDLAATFDQHKVSLEDLDEYLKWVDTPEFAFTKHIDAARSLSGPEQPVAPYTSNAVKLMLPTASTNLRVKKKLTGSRKSHKERLGFCDDPDHKEILDRQSDEEFEYVHDYMPLMTRGKSKSEFDNDF
jgi:hypothetical protein